MVNPKHVKKTTNIFGTTQYSLCQKHHLWCKIIGMPDINPTVHWRMVFGELFFHKKEFLFFFNVAICMTRILLLVEKDVMAILHFP